jgi:GNAT superfamily N-acetyltransferase
MDDQIIQQPTQLEQPQFIITEMQPEDVAGATNMRLQSWLDTYVNEDAGVTQEWIEARNYHQRHADKHRERVARLQDPNHGAWVAKDMDGTIIGCTTPYRDKDGVQHVGSLYVAQEWHGKGVGAALMQKAIEWSDPTKPMVLGVVAYNDRAKNFYKKWGFTVVPHSRELFDNKIPEVMMERKGDQQV